MDIQLIVLILNKQIIYGSMIDVQYRADFE